jgi:hypothetical protein
MKTTIIAAGLGALALAGAATSLAAAQTPAPSAPAPAAAGNASQRMAPGQGGPRAMDGGMRRGPRFEGRGGRGFRGPTSEEMRQLQEQRNARLFGELDANKDGRVTQQEFTAYRERTAFQRFSGGQDSVTLPQLNARTAERFNRGPGRRAGPGPAPAAPAAPVR